MATSFVMADTASNRTAGSRSLAAAGQCDRSANNGVTHVIRSRIRLPTGARIWPENYGPRAPAPGGGGSR